MSLNIEKKGFKEQVDFVKESFYLMQIHFKNIMYFSLFTLILFTVFDYLNNHFFVIDPTKISMENPYSQGSIMIMVNEFIKTIFYLYIIGIMGQSYLFFEDNVNKMKILKSFISVKYYLNLMFLGFFILLTALLCGHIGLPAGLVEGLVQTNNDPEKFNMVLKKYDDIMTTTDYLLLIGAFIFFVISFLFLLFSSYISYMNIKLNDIGIIKGNFKTYLGLLKNILYWFIPCSLYFLGVGLLINSIIDIKAIDTIMEQLIRNITLSLYLGFGSILIFKLKHEIFPVTDNFDPEKAEKERIKKKYEK